MTKRAEMEDLSNSQSKKNDTSRTYTTATVRQASQCGYAMDNS